MRQGATGATRVRQGGKGATGCDKVCDKALPKLQKVAKVPKSSLQCILCGDGVAKYFARNEKNCQELLKNFSEGKVGFYWAACIGRDTCACITECKSRYRNSRYNP